MRQRRIRVDLRARRSANRDQNRCFSRFWIQTDRLGGLEGDFGKNLAGKAFYPISSGNLPTDCFNLSTEWFDLSVGRRSLSVDWFNLPTDCLNLSVRLGNLSVDWFDLPTEWFNLSVGLRFLSVGRFNLSVRLRNLLVRSFDYLVR